MLPLGVGLLGGDAPRLLCLGVVGELGGTGGHGGLHDALLEVVEQVGVVRGAQGDGHAGLTRTARTTDTMHVVCNGRSGLYGYWNNRTFDKFCDIYSTVNYIWLLRCSIEAVSLRWGRST